MKFGCPLAGGGKFGGGIGDLLLSSAHPFVVFFTEFFVGFRIGFAQFLHSFGNFFAVFGKFLESGDGVFLTSALGEGGQDFPGLLEMLDHVVSDVIVGIAAGIEAEADNGEQEEG